MPADSRPKQFHVMEFAHHDEAAAFVAALSRFLDLPKLGAAGAAKSKKSGATAASKSKKNRSAGTPKSKKSVAGSSNPKIEVWARSPVASEGVLLFLSATALAAAESAFSPVPVARTIKREALPDECFLIIEGGVTQTWGAAEASARLSPP
jgi:hypothetical protein